MKTDPNPKVRTMQVILFIAFIISVLFLFINVYVTIISFIFIWYYNHQINQLKQKDGFSERRKQMGIV